MRTPCLKNKRLSNKKYKQLTSEKLSCQEDDMFHSQGVMVGRIKI